MTIARAHLVAGAATEQTIRAEQALQRVTYALSFKGSKNR
jgi:hypothetical protein